jgi:hypothetical protein
MGRGCTTKALADVESSGGGESCWWIPRIFPGKLGTAGLKAEGGGGIDTGREENALASGGEEGGVCLP